MARWKVIDSAAAKELGIAEVSADTSGFILLDITKIPPGMSAIDAIEQAEDSGIIVQYDKKEQG